MVAESAAASQNFWQSMAVQFVSARTSGDKIVDSRCGEFGPILGDDVEEVSVNASHRKITVVVLPHRSIPPID